MKNKIKYCFDVFLNKTILYNIKHAFNIKYLTRFVFNHKLKGELLIHILSGEE